MSLCCDKHLNWFLIPFTQICTLLLNTHPKEEDFFQEISKEQLFPEFLILNKGDHFNILDY